MAPAPARARWGPVRSLLSLSPLIVFLPWYAYREYFALPKPLTELFDPQTSLPQISETTILQYAKELSEDVGYRTVGTLEHALGDEWMMKRANELKAQCDEIVKAQPGRKLQCEVYRQQGSGSHRFDIMGKRLYKTYVELTNIIVVVSDGTPEGKEHSVLVNAHVDSTLPSPGAADDAISVGVMLECIRVLINTPQWEPKHAIVFLFNNAEESLQDGSHLFSTKHPLAKSVRAAINLEAAGSTGPELLFQATSEQMIEAYSRVPRPSGTIIANEIFSSGIMMSDTDFRQFELYLNVTGLDMAIVGNSYLYHMRKDLVENIEPGVAQHMGENTMALLQYLSGPESPLPSLTTGYTKPTTVYFQAFTRFFMYSFKTANILYPFFFGLALTTLRMTFVPPAPALKQGRGLFGDTARGIIAVGGAIVGAVVGANVVAFLMANVLKKPLSWFSVELSCLALYGPAALTGAYISQLFVPRVREQTVFNALVVLQLGLACAIQFLGLGSAALLFITGLPLLAALLAQSAVFGGNTGEYSMWTYVLGQFIPLTTGAQTVFGVLIVFVPLTGRMGEEAPAEHIIATIVAITGAYALPLSIPFIHRYSRGTLLRTIVLLTVVTTAAMAAFSMRSPFDAMHQKRVFVMHMENITSQEQHLHLAAADSAPGFETLVDEIGRKFGAPDLPPAFVEMDEWNADWDTIYPFSTFLSPYKMELPIREEFKDPIDYSFTVTTVNDTVNAAKGTRSLTLLITHPGIIWTSIAFDAHVLKWQLDDNPPAEYARHHIKEASFHGVDEWTLDLTIKLDGPSTSPTGSTGAQGGLRVDFVGIHEKAMWPAKQKVKHEGGRAMVLFEQLDTWLDETTGGAVDATMLGCVGGVAWV